MSSVSAAIVSIMIFLLMLGAVTLFVTIMEYRGNAKENILVSLGNSILVVFGRLFQMLRHRKANINNTDQFFVGFLTVLISTLAIFINVILFSGESLLQVYSLILLLNFLVYGLYLLFQKGSCDAERLISNLLISYILILFLMNVSEKVVLQDIYYENAFNFLFVFLSTRLGARFYTVGRYQGENHYHELIKSTWIIGNFYIIIGFFSDKVRLPIAGDFLLIKSIFILILVFLFLQISKQYTERREKKLFNRLLYRDVSLILIIIITKTVIWII